MDKDEIGSFLREKKERQGLDLCLEREIKRNLMDFVQL